MALENRVAVIAGATGGLGRVVTKELAAQGLRVALLGSEQGRLDALVTDLGLQAGKYSTHLANVEDAAEVQNTAKAVMDAFGQVDVLFNFVGGWSGGKPVVETDPQAVRDMLSQHLWSTFYLAQAFVPHLIANKWGRIALVSSPTATTPQANRSPYAVGRAAQQALLLTLAQELKGTGVTANMVVVNMIDTKHERDSAPSHKNAEWTTPEEITSALLYLLSDEAHVVNGARIVLYGGA